MWGLATCAVIAFAAGLWVMLRKAEGEPALFAMLFGLALLLTQAVVGLSGFSALLVLGYRADTLALPTVQMLSSDLTYLGAALSAFPWTALAIAPSLRLRRPHLSDGGVPGLDAWLAIVVAVLHPDCSDSFCAQWPPVRHLASRLYCSSRALRVDTRHLSSSRCARVRARGTRSSVRDYYSAWE